MMAGYSQLEDSAYGDSTDTTQGHEAQYVPKRA
jgi:hypothetical protein